MKKFMPVSIAAIALLAIALATEASAGLVNPGFEYGVAAGSLLFKNDANTTPSDGWFTTEADHEIEIWGSGFNGVPAYQGTDFVELNANAVGTLYQTTTGIATGNNVDYHFAHRGRAGVDTMALTITDLTTGTVLFTQNYSDGNAAWGFYSGTFAIGPGVSSTDTIEFAYVSVFAAGGPTVGNFLDDADFGVGVNGTVPEPDTLALIGLCLVGLGVNRRRKSRM